jgi:hypothetical protein
MGYGSDPRATQGKKNPSPGLETRTGLNEEKKNITILDCFGFGLWTELNPNPNQTKLGLV